MNASSHFRLLLCGLGVLALASASQAQEITLLVQQLGSPQYQTRENASRALRKEILRQDVLERLRGPFPDPEIDHRAHQLREEYIKLLKPTSLPTLPWIDMLPATGYPGAEQIMRDYLSRSGGHGRSPLWVGDIEATRLWVRDLAAQRVPREQILTTLNAMAEVQKRSNWYKDYIRALEK